MKKTILTFILTGAATAASFAQEIILDSVDARGFAGVQAIQQNIFYSTAYAVKTSRKDSFDIKLVQLNPNMQTIFDARLRVKDGIELGAYCNGDLGSLLFLNNRSKKTRTIVLIDRMGNVMKKKTEEGLAAADFLPENAPKIFPAMSEGFIVLSAVNGKQKGYEFKALDKDLNTKWKKAFVPEKGSWTVLSAKAIMDRVMLVRKWEHDDASIYSIQTIQVMQGDAEPTPDMIDGEDAFRFSTINEHEGNMTTVCGLYYKGVKLKTEEGGIFLAPLDPSGHSMRTIKIPFSKLYEHNKVEAVRLLAQGKLRVQPVDAMHNMEGGYTVVLECYRQAADEEIKDATKKGTGYVSTDFIFLRLNEEGEVTGVDQASKPSRIAIVANKPATFSDAQVADWLLGQNFFCYRGMTQAGNKNYVYYKSYKDEYPKLAFEAIGITAPMPPVDMNVHPAADAPKSSRIVYLDMADNSKSQDKNDLFNDILPANQRGQVAIYQLSDNKLILSKHLVAE